MKKRGSKKGALEISFGMIFSIFLIIIFIAAAFYAIRMFLSTQDDIKIGIFVNDLKKDVDAMWKGSSESQKVEYSLPSKVQEVCFVNNPENSPNQNLIFTSSQIIPGKKIDNLDIAKITESENPYCIANINGKVKMTIVKDYGEILVRIER